MRQFVTHFVLLLVLCVAGCSDPVESTPKSPLSYVTLTTDKSSYEVGEAIEFELKNGSSQTIYYSAILTCPPRLYRLEGEDWVMHQTGEALPCPAVIAFRPLEPSGVWRGTMSSERSAEWLVPGTYRDAFAIAEKESPTHTETIYSQPFDVGAP